MFVGIGNAINLSRQDALSFLNVSGKAAGYGLDLTNERYFVDRVSKSFADAITHAASSNATMVDSDGLLKWRPHNLLTYSEQFDNAAWVKTDATVTANAAVAPDGTTTADLVDFSASVSARNAQILSVAAGEYTFGVWIKSVYGSGDFRIALIQQGGSGSTKVVAVNDGEWTFASVSFAYSGSPNIIPYAGYYIDGSYVQEVYLWGAHLYRSDLGGMVDNPDTGNSYVPTTSSAVYLPRRGHHVYNGDSWVNKGLLHESEARTNLLLQSQDLSNVSVWANINYPTRTDNGDDSFTIGDDSASGFEGISQSVSITSGSGTYTASVHVKKTTGGTSKTAALNFRLTGGTQVRNNVRINTDTGEVINPTTADVVDAGTYWIVCASVTDNSSGNNLAQFDIYPATANHGVAVDDASVVGSATFRYPQLEAGSTPSSYIPTSGATVTRAAETLTVPAANLPWPSPVVIGEELVTNGTFDTDTDWTKTGATTISGGKANLDGTSGTGLLYQNILAQGRVYQASFDIDSISGTMTVINNDGLTLGTYTTSGSKSLVFVNSNASGNFLFRVSTGSNTATIDNISVKEINPLAVSLQMQGEMTYADEGTFETVVPVRWYLDGSNYIRTTIDTNASETGEVNIRQSAASVLDLSTSVQTAYTPDINVPFNIASRHGSTFINGAVGGTTLTANTTPTALPDLPATDLQLGYDFNGTIKQFRMWADDLGDTGIAEATAPSTVPSLSLTFDGQSTSFTDTGMVV